MAASAAAPAAPSPAPVAPEPTQDEMVGQLLKAFAELDHDHAGHITAEELLELAKKRHKSLTLDEARLSIASKDLNQDGTLSLSEWLHYYSTGTTREDPTSDDHVLEFMYSWFDDDGNHKIDKDELRGALFALDVPATDEFVDKILSDVASHRPHVKTGGAKGAKEGGSSESGGKGELLSLEEFKEAVREGLKAAPDLRKAREEAIDEASYHFCPTS